MKIVDESNAEEELSHEIVQRLVAYNDSVGPAENYKKLVITARNDDGELVGGVVGATHFEWLYVSHLWVSNGVRRSGLGTSLLREAERLAKEERNCKAVWLDTFSFQAKPFYEKLGYVEFGRLNDYPPGFSRFFLTKWM